MAEADDQDLIWVIIGGTRFAVSAEEAKEILPLAEYTSVPGWPEHALGLLDVRGELIPLLDAAKLLGRQRSPLSARQLVLVVPVDGRSWGLLLDQVQSVHAAKVTGGAELPISDPLRSSGFLRGLASSPEGRVIVLDAAAVVRRLDPGGQLQAPLR